MIDATDYATKRDLVELRLDINQRFAPRSQVEELEGSVHEAEKSVAVIQAELKGIRTAVDKLDATLNKFLWAMLAPFLAGLVAIVLQVMR